MSTHGRSASHGGGWFQGTMEVISGMAPRPTTPQQQQQSQARSMSAPNSPARPGMFPGINRLPSQDSLDRSIHNESGHGKSTAQIIRDLKQSNAALSAKQASQEAQFMNKLAMVTKSFEDSKHRMEGDMKHVKKQMAHLEAYKAAADSKLKEKDAGLSKVKEESAFQRHTISDLKNQLYQLQTELDDKEETGTGSGVAVDTPSRQEMDQLFTDNQEMARELARLQAELRESERVRQERIGSPSLGRPPTGGDHNSYYQKYQETHTELERHRQRLSATETSLQGLEAEKQNLQQQHAKTVEELQEDLDKQSSQWKRRERDLQSQIESLEFTDSQVTLDLKKELESRDEKIADLSEELQQYADKAAELAAHLTQAREEAATQDHYRRDEVEDLRVLHDAQEEEITQLRKQLDEAQREVEIRDEELEETNAQLERVNEFSSSNLAQTEEVEKLRQELTESQNMLEKSISDMEVLKQEQEQQPEGQDEATDDNKELATRASELEKQLEESKETASRLEQELNDSRQRQEKQIIELQAEIDKVAKEKSDVSSQLQNLEKERNDALEKFEETNDEFSKLKSHWEGKESVAQEAEALKKEIAIHKQRVQDASDSERNASNRMKELETALEKSAQDLKRQTELANAAAETSRSVPTSDAGSKSLEAANEEIATLKEQVDGWESGATTNRLRKQLREAQIALVALDDEKKEMSQQHRELLSAVEKKKEEIQRSSQEKLASKEQELEHLRQRQTSAEAQRTQLEEQQTELGSQKSLVRDLQGEKVELQKQIESLEAAVADAAMAVNDEAKVGSISPSASKELEATISSLTEERDKLKVKLKDRDTTIAALVKSSVQLENKISAMENNLHDVRSVQSEEKKVTDEELFELRRTVASMKNTEPRMTEEVQALKKDVKAARQDAKRWKKALKEDGNTGSEYRYQIAVLSKELERNGEKLKESDQAIENLVNQSISQETHVRELKTRISALMKEVETVRSQRARHSDDGMLRAEIHRLQQETEMFAGQIIEQDEELQNVKINLERKESQVLSLTKELTELRVHGAPSAGNQAELTSLQSDLEKARSSLQKREVELSKMQKQLHEAKHKSDSKKVIEMQAELDEMREASEDNRSELRDLRRQLWDAKEAAGAANDLKLELAQAKYAFDEYKRTAGVTSTADTGSSSTIKKLEMDLAERDSRITQLESTNRTPEKEELNRLRGQMQVKVDALNTLEKALIERDAALEKSESLKFKLAGELANTKEALSKMETESGEKSRSIDQDDDEKKALLKEKEKLFKEKEVLVQEVADLKKQTESLEKLQKEQEELKVQLDQGQQAREASEKSIVEAYEKRLSAVAVDKDSAIDTLRKELAESRGKVSEEANDVANQLKELQSENNGLREQFEVELQAKNQQIYALEHTLHAQEQIVESMRAEMDQLQSGMEHATEKRRGEVEDLQQELMQFEGRALKQEREITALKMKMEESKLEHKAEVVRLKDVIVTMEKENPLAKTVAELQEDDRMLEVRQRLEQLKARNTTLQEENLKLGGRLERAVIEIKSFEAEKQHADEMEGENTKLRRQVGDLQGILESFRKSSKSSRSSTPSKTVSQPQATTDKENPSQPKDGKPVKSKKGLKGLFKRRNFSADEVIKEEEEATQFQKLHNGTMGTTRKIKVLVCTANLGNQQPDIESLNAWVPQDGYVKDVVDNPKYPLANTPSHLEFDCDGTAGRLSLDGAEDEDESQQQFDIVVFGMQEATFEEDDTTSLVTKKAMNAILAPTKAVADLTKSKNHIGKAQKQRERKLAESLRQSSFNTSRTPVKQSSLVSLNPPKPASMPGNLLSSSLHAKHSPVDSETIVDLDYEWSITEGQESNRGRGDTHILHDLLHEQLPSYQQAVSYQRGQMRLMLFFQADQISLDVISVKAQNTGKGGLANKGGIVTEVNVNGGTRLAFLTAHLEAHEGISKYQTRCSTVADILRGTKSDVTKCRCDASLSSHFMFAMGDLNFRTRLPDHEPGSKEHIVATHKLADSKEWSTIYKHDELCGALERKECFGGFATPPCNFPPTFKVNRQDGYSYIDKRSPSYTDRILYSASHQLSENVQVLAYEPIDEFTSSDHKPIRGAFEVELNPLLKWRPTLGDKGIENRELQPKGSLLKRTMSHKPKPQKPLDQRQYLHIFVSSIRCQIIQNESKFGDHRPSPFVCFVSTPAEAIQIDAKNMWRRLKRKVPTGATKNLKNADGSLAWPKSRRRKNTFDAQWGNEVVQFKVRTHQASGVPIDLTGAMIHVVVFDGKTSEKRIGTFTMNLASLIAESQRTTGPSTVPKPHASPGRRIRAGFRNSLVGLGGAFGHGDRQEDKEHVRPGGGRRQSLTNLFHFHREPETPKQKLKLVRNEGNIDSVSTPRPGEGGTVEYPPQPKEATTTRTGKNMNTPNGESNKNYERGSSHLSNGNEHGSSHLGPLGEAGRVRHGPSDSLRRAVSRPWFMLGTSMLHRAPVGRLRANTLGSLNDLDIQSIKLDEPLRKNGVEVGRIQFTLDSCWLSDEAARERRKEEKERQRGADWQ